jgi:putative transposase
VKLAYKYRAYPKGDAANNAAIMLWRCRTLYNIALAQRIYEYKYNQRKLSAQGKKENSQYILVKRTGGVDGMEWLGLENVPIRVLQNVLIRLQRAYENFFRRVKEGSEKPGFPRFAGSRNYNSVTYDLCNGKPSCWSLSGDRLTLGNIGVFRMKLHRPWSGRIKTVTLTRENDQWYVCLSCDDVVVEAMPKTGKALGLYIQRPWYGITSEGRFITEPKWYRLAEAGLAQRQRVVSRRSKGSRRRNKARLLLAKYHAHIASQRRDYIENYSTRLLCEYDTIVINKLALKEEVAIESDSEENKATLDNGWGMFIARLKQKAEQYGKSVIETDLEKIQVNRDMTPVEVAEFLQGRCVPSDVTSATHIG